MSSQVPAIKRPSDSYHRVSMIGYGVIILTFGVVGAWAALAPLSSAVMASGIISVESNRKTVQDSEGGILQKILVKEGDKVRAGQVLFEMDPTLSHANYEITRNELFTDLAQEARLIAERDNLKVISMPRELLDAQNDPIAQSAMADESRQFTERQATIAGQVGILESRIEQSRTEIEGLDREQASVQQQVDLLNDEIAGVQTLFDKGLVPKPRLLALQRDRAALLGQIGRLIADHSKADQSIGETTLQIRQIKQQFYQEVSKDLSDVRSKIAEIREKYTVAADTARRVNLVAPVSGSAQNLRVFTNGAVVRPGDALVDVIPDNEDLIVQARFSPNDVNNVHQGQTAEVRFPSFHDRTLPVIYGVIRSVSRDRLVDEATHQPYFLAIITVESSKLPKPLRGRLIAGLPVEAIVPTGSRTLLRYLTDPLLRTLGTSMREK